MRNPQDKHFSIFNEKDCLHIPKGWGKEIILHNSDDFCAKILRYNTFSTSSLHIHRVKSEALFVRSGKFIVKCIDTKIGKEWTQTLVAGDCIYIPPCQPHQLICQEAGDILESSTQDFPDDSYRISAGDSQKQ